MPQRYKATSSSQLPDGVQQAIESARESGKKIVLVTGVFDIFHAEHKRFLERARKAGDFLLVGIESDLRVQSLKGPNRPINSEEQRWQMVSNQGIADSVFVLPEAFTKPEHYISLIETIRPAVLAVSSHTNHLETKQKILELVGGSVKVVHEHNPRVSTTLLVASELEE